MSPLDEEASYIHLTPIIDMSKQQNIGGVTSQFAPNGGKMPQGGPLGTAAVYLNPQQQAQINELIAQYEAATGMPYQGNLNLEQFGGSDL